MQDVQHFRLEDVVAVHKTWLCHIFVKRRSQYFMAKLLSSMFWTGIMWHFMHDTRNWWLWDLYFFCAVYSFSNVCIKISSLMTLQIWVGWTKENEKWIHFNHWRHFCTLNLRCVLNLKSQECFCENFGIHLLTDSSLMDFNLLEWSVCKIVNTQQNWRQPL